MKKVLKEWFINAPWGKIALISWGNPTGDPILLVHGRLDSAATFIPLLEPLPDTYHYVAVDLPGNGLSDPLPIAVMLQRLFPVVVIEMVVDHLKWSTFTYIGHSMGGELGLFYNAIFPGKCKRCVYLDSAPAVQRLLIQDYSEHYNSFYTYYYDNYESINKNDRVLTERDAINAVMKARGMSKEQAEVILSRNLRKVGTDQYKLSWDKRQKILAPMFNTLQYYYELFTGNLPPTLLISAKDFDGGYKKGKRHVEKLIAELSRNENFRVVHVDGGHDVHFKKPETVVGIIKSFLEEETPNAKSKL